jgi:hypothetical protein
VVYLPPENSATAISNPSVAIDVDTGLSNQMRFGQP